MTAVLRAMAAAAVLAAASTGPAAAEVFEIELFSREDATRISRDCAPSGTGAAEAVLSCAGPKGHALAIRGDAERFDLDLAAPGWAGVAEIDLDPYLGSGPRRIRGDKIYWRGTRYGDRTTPVAIIVPMALNAGEGAGPVGQRRLLVIRVDPGGPALSCPIAILSGAPNRYHRAAEIADAAIGAPCVIPTFFEADGVRG